MAFSGNVASITLDEVFAFLANNALEGKLIIRSGEAALTLFFRDRLVFFPASGRRGTYSLNAILRHTGVISPEALAGYLQDLQQKLAAPQDQESEELKAARRMQYTEEIHDLFLWGDAAFEFQPCRWPQQAVAEQRLGRGLAIATQSLLMEAARRADDRLRIRRWIPSGRLILRCTTFGALPRVLAALETHNLEREDPESDPFADQRNLDDLLTEWRVPHHLILATLSQLVKAGDLEPLPGRQAQARFEELLGEDYLGGAARFLAHWVDLNEVADGEPLELVFGRSGAFRFGPLTAVTLRLPGPRTFALLRVLLAGATPFTLILRRRGREKRIVGGPEEVSVSRRGPWTRSATPSLREYLRKLGHLTPLEMAKLPDDEAAVAAVPPEAFSEALVAKLIDELAEVAYWAPCDIELHNVAVKDKTPETELSVGLGVSDREQLEQGLAGWDEILRRVPGEDCIFVLPRARTEDGAPSFFTRFELSRRGGSGNETQASTLEFARFVSRGLDLGWLRQATQKELLAGVKQARAQRNDVLAYRLVLAGQAQGFGAPFGELVESYQRADVALPGRLPSLQGDLKGVGLAAVLQALHNQQRTGTLTVSSGRRHQNLFFSRGDAFLLRLDDGASDEFVSFFLDSDDPDAVAPRFLAAAAELVDQEAAELENDFLDALLWEEATFAYMQNDLPEPFFDAETPRVALETWPFLLRAMERLREWDRVSTVVGDGKTVLQFCDHEAKLEAIQRGQVTEALTLIDGRLDFDALVRISQQHRLEVGRTVAGLVEGGQLTILPGIPDPIPD